MDVNSKTFTIVPKISSDKLLPLLIRLLLLIRGELVIISFKQMDFPPPVVPITKRFFISSRFS